jgi:hypothetical protein
MARTNVLGLAAVNVNVTTLLENLQFISNHMIDWQDLINPYWTGDLAFA